MIAALEAGQAVGGDKRGQQSAAILPYAKALLEDGIARLAAPAPNPAPVLAKVSH